MRPLISDQAGALGEFTACTKYPECKYVKHKTTGVNVEDADKAARSSTEIPNAGKIFFGCSNYPDCDFVLVGIGPVDEHMGPECDARHRFYLDGNRSSRSKSAGP